jgi:3-hydroxyacyl-CoA dehydrogenase/enoyl-CoA hydratase/3-hydroxybutyryl-CoA epimerase
MQGRRLNVLDEEFFREFLFFAEQIDADSMKRPVILRSGKEKGFVVGADLKRIIQIQEASEIQEFLRIGQVAFGRWESLSVPTIAWIDGPCLGGGLELALACHYRIASDAADTLLGLPESKLGLTPGWGGTQRLPSQVGIEVGLEMLFSGEPVGAERALAVGLIDGIWNQRNPASELSHWIKKFRGQALPNRRRLSEFDRYQEDWAHCKRLRQKATEMSNDPDASLTVPARQAIANYIEIGLNESFEAGERAERENFFALLCRPEVQAALQRFARPRPK